MPSYKLYYFPARAVGEVVRQIFAYSGVEYEDNRVTHEEWAAFKSKTPFGQMPVLEVDGKQIPQSFAIARFLASQHGLTGACAFEAAWVDALADQYKDYMNEFRNYWYLLMGYRQGDKDAAFETSAKPARDSFYPILTKALKDAGSGFLVGKAVTWVDFLVADHVATVQVELPGFLDAYPEVVAHAAKVRELPAIKAWIEKRPVTRG